MNNTQTASDRTPATPAMTARDYRMASARRVRELLNDRKVNARIEAAIAAGTF